MTKECDSFSGWESIDARRAGLATRGGPLGSFSDDDDDHHSLVLVPYKLEKLCYVRDLTE